MLTSQDYIEMIHKLKKNGWQTVASGIGKNLKAPPGKSQHVIYLNEKYSFEDKEDIKTAMSKLFPEYIIDGVNHVGHRAKGGKQIMEVWVFLHEKESTQSPESK